jgi:hypothetical protein
VGLFYVFGDLAPAVLARIPATRARAAELGTFGAVLFAGVVAILTWPVVAMVGLDDPTQILWLAGSIVGGRGRRKPRADAHRGGHPALAIEQQEELVSSGKPLVNSLLPESHQAGAILTAAGPAWIGRCRRPRPPRHRSLTAGRCDQNAADDNQQPADRQPT